MKLTTKQVADALGCSVAAVQYWGKRGKLARKPVGVGTKRVHFVYDSRSVAEFKRERDNGHPRPGPKPKGPALPAEPVLRAHSLPPSLPFDEVVQAALAEKRTGTNLSKLFARLDAIDAKLEHLIKVWS